MPNLFVARTFSKAYGLAGFRVGVLVGEAAQMKHGAARQLALQRQRGGAGLPGRGARRPRVHHQLRQPGARRPGAAGAVLLASASIPFWPSRANFVLAYFGDYRKPLVAEMRRRGILVRDRNSDPGCAGCVRITVGTRRQTDRLLRELRCERWRQSALSRSARCSAAEVRR